MRIVIDLQGAQSESRFRGIGRYSLNIAKAIAENRQDNEVIIALNGLFFDTIEPIRAEFDGILPQENIRIWHGVGPVWARDPQNKTRIETSEKIREAFLLSFNPDIVLITSLFEGFIDNAVTSIKTFDQKTPVAVIVYDLIPLLMADVYLKPNPLYKSYYFQKIEHLKKADLYLSISDSSKDELTQTLGVSPDAVSAIYAGIDTKLFKKIDISLDEKETLFKKFSIKKDFLMYTGAGDSRKNQEGLIKAYARLSPALRKHYQLVFVAKFGEKELEKYKDIIKQEGLNDDDVVFTGYISDEELAKLYNLCTLFVFPSKHEGFGLPALEAMACGAAVIGSNTSSIPEVIGSEEALFDPYDVKSIADKMEYALENDSLLQGLKQYGLNQANKFSWTISAKIALEAMEHYFLKSKNAIDLVYNKKPKLALLTPLPPEKSGISDYSAELLPYLSKYYDIDVVVNQNSVTDEWISKNLNIRDIEYFKDNYEDYARVLYHIGNSPFHSHMFDLIEHFSGIAVLHDFFLSSIMAYLEIANKDNTFINSLYLSHGYRAVKERAFSELSQVILEYPCNLSVIENALGVIVHSEFSKDLAEKYYGKSIARGWRVIPQLRNIAKQYSDDEIKKLKKELRFAEDDFIVCSFGFLDKTKLNDKLLKAYMESDLVKNKNCYLIFVGENEGGEYGKNLLKNIESSGLTNRIKITGYADRATYQKYLAVCDMAVQLRTLSRGETSRAILDCMAHSKAVICNANGSFGYFPKNCVYMLNDDFGDEELIKALQNLYLDGKMRKTLGENAKEYIKENNDPQLCAKKYFEAIEALYQKQEFHLESLINAVVKQSAPIDSHLLKQSSQAIALSFPNKVRMKQLFVDVSALVQTDLKTGIQRVTRSVLKELLENPPIGYKVEPVYARGDKQGYFYARNFTMKFLNCPDSVFLDEPIDYSPGDIFLGIDLNHGVILFQKNFLSQMRNLGVKIYFVVYDLLPVSFPQFFPEGTDAVHQSWLNTICEFEGALCISNSVAKELYTYYETKGHKIYRPFKISWFHLGADIENSLPTKGLPENAQDFIESLLSQKTFLMVGTVEPRKGHIQTILAFEKLWEKGFDINLVLVGKEGWEHLPDNLRRTIPTIAEKIKNHPYLNKRLFWLQGISDEYLEKIYASSVCIIMASEGEGFGLPLIEAAKHKTPIIARDIPVFREVAGDFAYYFENSADPKVISDAIERWLELYAANTHPRSDNMPYQTYKQSTQRILDIILNDKFEYKIKPSVTNKGLKIFSNKRCTEEDIVKDIYNAMFRRVPEPDAVKEGSKMIAEGHLRELLSSILESEEFERLYLEGTDLFNPTHPVDMISKPLDIFIHIPKSAGSSMYLVLVDALGKDYVSSPFARLSAKPPSRLYKYNILFGHLDYDEAMLLTVQEKKRLFTFLRDPVTRLISTYYYWRSYDVNRNLTLAKIIIANKYNIKEFFTNQDIIEKTNIFNESTRFVMGYRIWNEWKRDLEGKTQSEIERFIEDEVRERVKDRLKEYSFIGLQEDFERSTRTLLHILGKDCPNIARSNVTSENMNLWGFKKVDREEITPDVKEAIESITMLDRVVYDEGKRMYLEFVRKQSEIPATPFSIDFSSGGNSSRFIVKGFCGVESWGTWSSGRECAISFNLVEFNKKPLFIKLYFNVLTKGGYSQNIEFYLNDNLLDKKTYSIEYDELTFDVSKLVRRENTLTIKIPNAISPKSLGINEDERELGIGLIKIDLFS